jgi:hypothetical protein
MSNRFLLIIALVEAVGAALFFVRSLRPFPNAPSPDVTQRAFRLTSLFALVGSALFTILWAQVAFRWFEGSRGLQFTMLTGTVVALGLAAWVYARALRSLTRELRHAAPSRDDAA